MPVSDTLRELIASSRALLAAAENGNAEGVTSTLAARQRLIAELPPSLADEGEDERQLLATLVQEDRLALEGLAQWRARLKRDLAGTDSARAAAAGYARVAESNPAVIDRDL